MNAGFHLIPRVGGPDSRPVPIFVLKSGTEETFLHKAKTTAQGKERPRGARFYGATIRPRFLGQVFLENIISLAGRSEGIGAAMVRGSHLMSSEGGLRAAVRAAGSRWQVEVVLRVLRTPAGGGAATRPHV